MTTVQILHCSSHRRRLLILIGAVLCSYQGASAQQVSIVGGNQTITITSGVAGGEPTAVTNTSCTLRYRGQTAITKVTVQSSCPGQRFSLSVVTTNPQRGTAAPAVTLTNGMPAADFITSIPVDNRNRRRTATLRYTASATFSQGNSSELGNDIHTVTYTLVAQ